MDNLADFIQSTVGDYREYYYTLLGCYRQKEAGSKQKSRKQTEMESKDQNTGQYTEELCGLGALHPPLPLSVTVSPVSSLASCKHRIRCITMQYNDSILQGSWLLAL